MKNFYQCLLFTGIFILILFYLKEYINNVISDSGLSMMFSASLQRLSFVVSKFSALHNFLLAMSSSHNFY